MVNCLGGRIRQTHLLGTSSLVLGSTQAAQAYSLYFVWNFGSERFIRLCMGV